MTPMRGFPMPKINQIALIIKLDNGIELTVPAWKIYSPHSCQIDISDTAQMTTDANEVLAKLKED